MAKKSKEADADLGYQPLGLHSLMCTEFPPPKKKQKAERLVQLESG